MGALYGYIKTDVTNAVNIKDKMSSPADYWGKDEHFVYNDTNAVIGYLHRYNTPESIHEKQPCTTLSGDILFFNGRIDNREELSAKVSIKDSPEIPDGQIASSAWQKYGNDMVNHLEGDWVIIVWNPSRRALTILRDHHGYSALYYYCGNGFFAFATSIKSLLALDEILKIPDMKRVAQAITSWQGDGLHSAYKDILRLPPAHIMEVNDRLNVTTTLYWHPENIKPVYYKNEDEYYQRFYDEYQRAVRVRLRSYKPVGSQLSGGLDSGTVVTLAAMQLKKSGLRLPAFTQVPASSIEGLTSKNRFGDEGRLAKMTADFTGNTDWFPIDAADVNPFEAIREGVQVHDEPFHAGANTFWINEIKKVAQQMGLGSMLTGQGGNATVSWPTPGFLQIMSQKKDLISFNHFISYAGWRRVILPVIVPDSVKNLIHKKRKGKLPFIQYSAMKKEYAESNKILEQMLDGGHNPWFTKPSTPLQSRLKILKPGSSIVGFLHSQSAAWNNLEMRDPTFDKRLVEYCLSVPDHIYVAGGKDRLLIRKAFDGKMPPEVLWNTMHGRQSADIGHRVVKFSNTGYELLNEMTKSPLCNEILDIPRMKSILDSLCQKVSSRNNTEAGTILLRGITAGIFLQRFSN